MENEDIAKFETLGPIRRLLVCQVCGKMVSVRQRGRPPDACPECGFTYPWLEVSCKEVLE